MCGPSGGHRLGDAAQPSPSSRPAQRLMLPQIRARWIAALAHFWWYRHRLLRHCQSPSARQAGAPITSHVPGCHTPANTGTGSADPAPAFSMAPYRRRPLIGRSDRRWRAGWLDLRASAGDRGGRQPPGVAALYASFEGKAAGGG